MKRKTSALLDTGQSTIGWHRHGVILTCPRKFFYTYVNKREVTISGGARGLGTAIHQALSHHYLKHSAPKVFADLNLAEPAEAILLSLGKTSQQLRHAQFLWDQYVKFYPPAVDLQTWQVMEVESELWVKIFGEDYCQRADLVARRKSDGKVFIWDHKTMGGFGQNYGANQFGLSGQIVGLRWIGKELYGKDFGDVLINAIRTSPTNQSERFFRQAPPSAPGAVEGFPDLIQHARALTQSAAKRAGEVSVEDAVKVYHKVLDATVCHAYGGCEFSQHCRFES